MPEPLAGLLPGGGLARGSVVETSGVAAMSLALLLASGSSRGGSWLAVLGVDDLGLVAAAELGIDLERLVLVDQPGPDRWGTVAATLVEAFDVVVARPRHRVRPADARRLQARAREQGSVLVLAGDGAWPGATDLVLAAAEPVWEGLEQGHGHLRSRRVEVTIGGRRGAARSRRAHLWLPGPDGRITLVEPPVVDGPTSRPVSGADVVLEEAG